MVKSASRGTLKANSLEREVLQGALSSQTWRTKEFRRLKSLLSRRLQKQEQSKSWCQRSRFTGLCITTTLLALSTSLKTQRMFTFSLNCAKISHSMSYSEGGRDYMNSRFSAMWTRFVLLSSICTVTESSIEISSLETCSWMTRWKSKSEISVSLPNLSSMVNASVRSAVHPIILHQKSLKENRVIPMK